uniref:Uncharacterized protein n=1 Tax=Ditylenchus dipsaci TaxID=166011 RepID=A0A915CQ28_9BILA
MGVYILNLADLDKGMKNGESYKFIRMADDLHDVAGYLSEMRICFIMVTVTLYVLLGIFFLKWCVQRNANRQRQLYAGANSSNRRPNYQTTDEYQNATNTTNTGQTNTDDLVSVRSDGHVGTGSMSNKTPAGTTPSYMGRNHRSQAPPSFMRHGMQHINHQTAANNHESSRSTPTTRLISNTAGPANPGNDTSGHHQPAGSAFHHHHASSHTHHPVPHIETQKPPEDTIIAAITCEQQPLKHINNSSAAGLVNLRHHRAADTRSQDSHITATDM